MPKMGEGYTGRAVLGRGTSLCPLDVAHRESRARPGPSMFSLWTQHWGTFPEC